MQPIIIQAGPETPYLLWQSIIQCYNFKKIGIDLSRYHFVVGRYPGSQGTCDFSRIKKEFPEANVFFYPYTEMGKHNYMPSIRPHVLKQHFKAHPELEKEWMWYIDADIILRVIPDWNLLCSTPSWKMSNGNSYIGLMHILDNQPPALLELMTRVMQIDPFLPIKNDHKAGGPHTLGKGFSEAFFAKMEKDCEALSKAYTENDMFFRVQKAYMTKQQEIYKQSIWGHWMLDLQVILYNAWAFGFDTEIRDELDFCFASDPIHRYNEVSIMHNAGVQCGASMGAPYEGKTHEQVMFHKQDYLNTMPFGVDLSYVSPMYCSKVYATEIENYTKSMNIPQKPKALAIYCTTNKPDPKVMRASMASIIKAKQESDYLDVTIVCVMRNFNGVDAHPDVYGVMSTGGETDSHLNIITSLQDGINKFPDTKFDFIFPTEHTNLYAPHYFDDAYLNFDNNLAIKVVSNLNYEGMNRNGWQKQVEAHEPFHQLGFRADYFIQLLEEKKAVCLRNEQCYLEPAHPNNRTKDWWKQYRTRVPNIHIDPSATPGVWDNSRFTSHHAVVYNPQTYLNHPVWGDHKKYIS
jgi:hypothetical protein